MFLEDTDGVKAQLVRTQFGLGLWLREHNLSAAFGDLWKQAERGVSREMTGKSIGRLVISQFCNFTISARRCPRDLDVSFSAYFPPRGIRSGTIPTSSNVSPTCGHYR